MPADADRRTRAGAVVRATGALLAAAFVALLVYGLVTQAPDSTIDDRLADGESAQAPGFELAVLADSRPAEPVASAWRRAAADDTVSLEELRGTPVVLNFWASWCEPCREEAPVLRRGAARWGERGALFVGLDMQDVTEDAHAFLREHRLGFPQVRDPDNAVARRWGVTGLPETFFISADGYVVSHVIGTVSAEQLDAGAAAAQRGRPATIGPGGQQRPTR